MKFFDELKRRNVIKATIAIDNTTNKIIFFHLFKNLVLKMSEMTDVDMKILIQKN